MILTCPECGTQYVVKDGAIPPGGRQVRCASCKHSWHQNPEESGAAILENGAVDAAGENPTEAADSTTDVIEDETGAAVAAESAGDEFAVPDDIGSSDEAAAVSHDSEEQIEVAPAVDAADEFTPFATSVDEPRRRGRAFGFLVAIVLIVLAALAFWYWAPADWKARVGLAEAAETPLQLMMTHSDRQRLASGNELLAISGRVINPTQEPQNVPPITAQLRDDKGKLVYSWTIAPPAPSLDAGASAPFYSAEVNVPAGGNELTVTLGAPKA
jgi:predicted Zn finger-like uncharacterized protein